MRPPVALPRLQAISRPEAGAAELERWAHRLVGQGVDWLQIRTFALADRELLATLRALRSSCRPEVRLTVNARPDLCRLADLDGVHLPTRGLSVEAARKVAGEGAVIGRSTHSLEEIRAAAAEGADYVLLAPVYSPLSKPAERPAAGLELLAAGCRLGLPVFALGGVTISRLGEVEATGAAGAAGISMFDSTGDLRPLIERARSVFSPPALTLPNPFQETPSPS